MEITEKRSMTEPFGTWIDWIRKNIIDPDTRLQAVNVIYCVIAMIFLLHHIPLTLYYPYYLHLSFALGPYISLVLVIPSVILGRLWKDKGFWLLFVLFVIKTIRYWLQIEAFPFFGQFAYAFAGCYAIGRVLTGERRKRFLLVFCSIWTVAMVVLSALSIYVSWTKQPILNYAPAGAIGFEDGYRLSPIYYCVHAGAIASGSIAVAMVGFCLVKKRIWKALFGISIIPIFIMGILTVSRSNHIVNAALLAIFGIMLIYQRIKTIKWWHVVLMILVAMIVFAGFTYLQSWGIRLFNYIRESGGIIVSNAYAEEVTSITPRDIDLENGINGFLNGRFGIWESLFVTMKANPSYYLWGSGHDNPMRLVNEYRAGVGLFNAAHMHNPWLQMLLENGIPGFLLYLGFTFYVVKCGLQQLFRKESPFWQRMIPLTVFACFIADLADITGHPDRGLPLSTILFFFAGLTVAFYQEEKQNKRALK